MKRKVKKRVFILALVMCYCLGNLLVPIYAEDQHFDDMTGFEDLLAERENAAGGRQETSENKETLHKADVSDFSDVAEEDWFYPYLAYLVENGMINGKTPTSFEPYSTFSYAECSAVIVRYLGLENHAQERQKEIVNRHPDMKNLWYVGYFETLSCLGLFEDYDLFETEDGLLVSVNRENANSPIVRYRFAESISKSFELDSEIRAENVYSEIGGRGREFIVGGVYNYDVLAEYERYIKDFSDIPEDSRENVLKSYYNGIFNGDVTGNFYPQNNLTRGEMAKVLATVSDYSLRTRLISDTYGVQLTDDMIHTDFSGEKTLKYSVWTEILETESRNLTIDDGCIQYKKCANAPMGYAIDVYLYKHDKDGYVLCNQSTLNEGDSDGFEEETDSARVLFVMRNVMKNSRTEGTYDVIIENGVIVSSNPLIREM